MQREIFVTLSVLEDLRDDDIALEVKTCDRFRLKTIIRLNITNTDYLHKSDRKLYVRKQRHLKVYVNNCQAARYQIRYILKTSKITA